MVLNMARTNSKVQHSLRDIHQNRLFRVGNSDVWYFKSSRKAFIIDGVDGEIYSLNLRGGHLVTRGNKLFLVSMDFRATDLIIDADERTAALDELNLCNNIRGSGNMPNKYKYITLILDRDVGSVKIYNHQIIALCKYGSAVYEKDMVVDHVNQYDKLNNALDNLELIEYKENSRRNRSYLNSLKGIFGLRKQEVI